MLYISRISNINILFSYTFPPELNTLIICYFSFSYLFNPSTYTLVLFHAYYFIFSFNMLTFFFIILEHLKFSSDIIWYWYLFLEALFSVDLSESILLVKKFLDFCLSKTMDFLSSVDLAIIMDNIIILGRHCPGFKRERLGNIWHVGSIFRNEKNITLFIILYLEFVQ